MNKKVLTRFGFAAFVLFAGYIAYSQQVTPPAVVELVKNTDPVVAVRLKAQANLLGQAFVAKNYEAIVAATYPKVVEMLGGKDAMAAFLKKSEDPTVSVVSVTIGEPFAIVESNGELQAVVPETIVLAVEGGRTTLQSEIIGISVDQGETWTFIDASKITDISEIRSVNPNISSRLVLSPKVEPVFVGN
jgi:hypothetical protein